MPLISIEKGEVLAFHIAACVGSEKNTGTVNYSKKSVFIWFKSDISHMIWAYMGHILCVY